MDDKKSRVHKTASRVMKYKNQPSFLWGMVVAAVLLGIIIWLVVGRQSNDKVVFSIQGQNYRVSDVDPIAQFAIKELNVSKSTEYRNIYQSEQYLTVAKNLGITPTSADIIAQQKLINSNYNGLIKLNSYAKWSYLVASQNAVNDLLQTKYQNGDYQGYSFIFWFGNLLSTAVTYTPPNYGNQTMINQDKQYAMQQANYYYGQLKNHKMTPDQIVKAVINDPKLGIDYQAGSQNNFSVHFGLDSTTPWQQQTFYMNVNNWILAQTQPTTSAIRTGQTELDPSTKKFGDTYYYFVELDKVGFSANQFNQDLKSLPSHYYGVNV